VNQENFTKGMTILREAFPAKLSSINLKIYFNELQDIEDSLFERGILKIIRSHIELYPDTNLLALIRQYCEGKLEDQALLAWEAVRNAIISVGAYKSVTFKDPLINGAISALGGWIELNNMLVEDEPFKRKEFLKLYETYKRAERECPKRLIGIHEKENKGLEETVMIECDWVNPERKQIK